MRQDLPVEVEGEDGVAHGLLRHHVVEDGRHAVHGDLREGHAQDAVKLGGDERQAGLAERLGERLVLHRHIAHLWGASDTINIR